MKGVVSKETVVLRRWGSSLQKFLFLSTELKNSFNRYEEINSFQFNGDSGILGKIRVFLNRTQIYDDHG